MDSAEDKFTFVGDVIFSNSPVSPCCTFERLPVKFTLQPLARAASGDGGSDGSGGSGGGGGNADGTKRSSTNAATTLAEKATAATQ